MNKKELLQLGIEQLGEKQLEEMDQMLAKRVGLDSSTHTDDQIRANAFAELFSGIPVQDEEEDK